MCGKELGKHEKDYCSPECVKQALEEQRRAKEREEYKKSEAEAIKRSGQNDLTAAQINELARAEGLNYGQYCAKYKLY